jgi:K+ transporter
MEKSPWLGVIVTFITSLIIGYILYTLLITQNETVNLTKITSVLLLAMYAVIVELILFMIAAKKLRHFGYISIILGIVVVVALLSWAIRKQKGVDQKQFMTQMIEHHEMALVMAREIKNKPQDPALRPIVDTILVDQQKELDEMRSILDRVLALEDAKRTF